MPKSQPLPPMTSDPMSNGRDNQNSLKKTRLFSAKNNDATVKNNTTMKKAVKAWVPVLARCSIPSIAALVYIRLR